MLNKTSTKLELLNAVRDIEKREALRATHTKSGTTHILTLTVSALPTTIFKIYFSATAAWVLGDTITLQDGNGTTICSPTIKTQANEDLPDAAFGSGATIELICDNGGSDAKLFFRVSVSASEIQMATGTFIPSSSYQTISITGLQFMPKYVCFTAISSTNASWCAGSIFSAIPDSTNTNLVSTRGYVSGGVNIATTPSVFSVSKVGDTYTVNLSSSYWGVSGNAYYTYQYAFIG